jgi:tyrosyl-tRNA synthetase
MKLQATSVSAIDVERAIDSGNVSVPGGRIEKGPSNLSLRVESRVRDPKKISDIVVKQHAENPGARVAHKALAKAATDLIHSLSATAEAIRASEILFGGNLDGIAESTFNEIVGEVPTKEIERTKLEGTGIPLVELLVHAGLSQSKGQARKDTEGGGVNINNVREASATRTVTTNDLLFGKHVLLRKGKKNYVVVTAR